MTVAIGYIGMMSEKSEERASTMEVIGILKRIYGAPKFLFYAVADGLYTVFAKGNNAILGRITLSVLRMLGAPRRGGKSTNCGVRQLSGCLLMRRKNIL